MVMAVLEGIVMCFVLLIICVVGITDGPVGMDYSRHRRNEAIHLWKDINRQMGLDTNRFSDIGCYNSLGGFENINLSYRGKT